MKCAIMQPTYLPWSGYFYLIKAVDYFVLLDDVQFERRSWQCRNQVLLNGQRKLLTVPVRKVNRSTVLRSIEIDRSRDWQHYHKAILEQAYGAAPYGADALAPIRAQFGEDYLYLADLNESLIRAICTLTSITTPLIRASTLRCGGKRSEHLAQICHTLSCDTLLSPRGSQAYLEQDKFEVWSGIKVEFMPFVMNSYRQAEEGQFVPSLSFIDAIAWLGPEKARQNLDPPRFGLDTGLSQTATRLQ